MPATSGTRRGNGAGKGDGWGGPAKGEGNHDAGPGAPDAALAAVLASDKEARATALRDHILKLALTATREETQLSAAVAYLNREEGTPIARSITVATDDLASLSDADLAAELERLGRVEAEVRKGGQPAARSAKPSGMVN